MSPKYGYGKLKEKKAENSVPKNDRIEYIIDWAFLSKDVNHPSVKTRVKHKFRDKLHKWKKPRNIAQIPYQIGMNFVPPGISHVIDWVYGKTVGKAKEKHYQKKYEESKKSVDFWGTKETLEGQGKVLKHMIKVVAKGPFDSYARKARKAYEAYYRFLKVKDQSGHYCQQARDLVIAWRYYARRLRILKGASTEMRKLLDTMDKWIAENEKFLDIHNPNKKKDAILGEVISTVDGESPMIKAIIALTDHPDFFCHKSNCVNFYNQKVHDEIMDELDREKNSKTQKNGNTYGRL